MPTQETSSRPTTRQARNVSVSPHAPAPGLKSPRKRRKDAGSILWTSRDDFAFSWMGHQYAIRLDHVQWLLGRFPGRGARHSDWISESAARDVIKRWERGQWARTGRAHDHAPFWVWPTRRALRKVGLTYPSYNLEYASLSDLAHLHALNEIRLHIGEVDEGDRWISERQLLKAGLASKGQRVLHRTDGEMHCANGEIIAIEAELSAKKPRELEEILMELLRGEQYLALKERYNIQIARAMSEGEQSRYSQIWYFAPKTIRRQIQQARARLVNQGDMSPQEARRLCVYWYPLTETDEEEQQEEQEEQEARHLYE